MINRPKIRIRDDADEGRSVLIPSIILSPEELLGRELELRSVVESNSDVVVELDALNLSPEHHLVKRLRFSDLQQGEL